jgi:hypothetical protein
MGFMDTYCPLFRELKIYPYGVVVAVVIEKRLTVDPREESKHRKSSNELE